MRSSTLSGFLLVGLCVGQLLFCTAATAQVATAQSKATALRMVALQSLLDRKHLELDEITLTLKSAPAYNIPELLEKATELKQEISHLNNSFERMAIGAVNMELFGEEETHFDWRDEVTQILQPMVENLKALTEKPRKIERLRDLIESAQQQHAAIETALYSIQKKLDLGYSDTTNISLTKLLLKWQRQSDQNSSDLEIAQLQLEQVLNSGGTWIDSVKKALVDFFKGRGLTLLITVIVGTLVWSSMRAVLWLFQLKPSHIEQNQFRTRRRLAQYAYRVLTVLLILISVITVFYVRGDRLLMGLSILAAAALALGLRHTVPRFLAETRLLLNIGATRENERVIYNGLPWSVVSLNMFTILRNPELTGIVRLPLSAIGDMVSRPAGKEPWFPSSKGDFILLSDGSLQEVVSQTSELVELRKRGGAITSVPSDVFYAWAFENLTRGGTFGLRCLFGINYQHLEISLTKVPHRLQAAIKLALSEATFGDDLTSVQVELASAGSSSLDYDIYLVLDSKVASSYLKIDRLVQQTCVAVCLRENWGIPFPHLTIQQYDAA